MSDTAEQVKGALIDAVVDFAATRNQAAGAVVDEAILRHYYDRAAPQDLTEKDPIDLYAATVRHFQLAHDRGIDETLVHVYNPDSDEDGWSSAHTVVDVVTDDMSFIVDSVLALLELRGLHVHVLVHPIFDVDRSAERILQSATSRSDTDTAESFLHIEIDRLAAGVETELLAESVRAVLGDVRASVEDWPAMRSQALILADELDQWATEASEGNARFVCTIGTDPAEVAELLRWMEAGAFTFTGYREYEFMDDPDHPTVVSRPETGLGTLRQQTPTRHDLGELPPEIAALSREPSVVNLTKANTLSTVHRSVPLDYVGVKAIDASGRVTGERRFIGLFTSTVYTGRVDDIPVVRAKVATVIERSHFNRSSHDHNRLLNTLLVHPRDELFQSDVDELEEMTNAILDLRDRRQVSFLLRRDGFGRFLSCLVFIPRDRHNTDLRLAIQRTLMEFYRGKSCRFSTEISDAPLARLHMVINTDPIPVDDLPDPSAVEARLSQIARTWDDYLRTNLIESHGEDRGLALLALYGDAFDPGYRSNVLAETAVHDIDRLDVLAPGSLDVALHRPLEARSDELRCKLYRSGDPITLSQFIPVLHDLGAVVTDERPYEVELKNGHRRFIYDIGLRLDRELDLEDRNRFREAVLAVWRGDAESDRLARLVATAGLSWRDVTVLRAYARYLIQIGSRFSAQYVIDTLNQNPTIAGQLITLFRARLDPDEHDAQNETVIRSAILANIDAVSSLDADRILRSFVDVIDATVRTNHWQTDEQGAARPALALKLDPRMIPAVPKPVPTAEIFVTSPRVEGVHLRAGRIARGGLRWSDRMEDFRTEILGLMKAQSVKNSVIVPVGAKGGFVARQLPPAASRDETMAEVAACYDLFVGALLDVTGNIADGHVMPPPSVVRHDGDDPYLVVAADKGTATFSDRANALAEARGFWLGDAFASGGSAGYDHKELGITARGAWLSVERHFRSLGIDVSATEFTAVGIGDMSGDVFGNGLLRSDRTRLVAAFDHRHVFIDPDPDAATSYAQRRRLYEMPRSTWADYERDVISAGGGVFERSAKSITITPQMRAALGIDDGRDELTPDQLIRAILLAPVDLLWNGGVGTYVKASFQTDAAVGDRTNDNVRVNGRELRCKVVAEGGNLGVTQQGRIEYARAGGHINTDAIDNSAGVDCSDHEVNLKILLSLAERRGDLTRKQRDQILASMAGEVTAHVLENNYSQNETLTAAAAQSPGMVNVHERLMQWLEFEVALDRSVESLPPSTELDERAEQGEGLTRPELAVLMAYVKDVMTEHLVDDDLVRTPLSDQLVADYFPTAVREQFGALVPEHRLRAELAATIISNTVVNRGGISMAHRLAEETSATLADIARAHLAAWRIFDLETLWQQVRALDNLVPAHTQTVLDLEIKRVGERTSRWLLRNESQPIDIAAVVDRCCDDIKTLHRTAAEGDLPDDVLADVENYIRDGVPPVLARQVAALGPAFGFLDLVNVATRTARGFDEVVALHAALDERLGLSWLREQITSLPRDDHWDTMARSALRDEYFREHGELTAAVLGTTSGTEAAQIPARALADRWSEANRVAVERYRRTISELRAAGESDLSHASVAVRALSQLTRTA